MAKSGVKHAKKASNNIRKYEEYKRSNAMSQRSSSEMDSQHCAKHESHMEDAHEHHPGCQLEGCAQVFGKAEQYSKIVKNYCNDIHLLADSAWSLYASYIADSIASSNITDFSEVNTKAMQSLYNLSKQANLLNIELSLGIWNTVLSPSTHKVGDI